MEIKATYERDTKRYHRFNIDTPEIRGTLYIRKDTDIPKTITIKLTSETKDNQ